MLRSVFSWPLGAIALLALGLSARPVDVWAAQQQDSREPKPNTAQENASQQGARIVSSDIAITREHAELKLQLANGQRLTLATVTSGTRGVQQSGPSGVPDDVAQILTLGVVRGDTLDQSWRQLLNQAMDAPADDLPRLLADWDAPEGGQQLDELLESALSGVAAANVGAPSPPQLDDSVSRLNERIQLLEQQRDQAVESRHARRGIDWFAPLRHVGRGLAGIMSVLVTFAVLFGIGFAIVFFGGRPYLDAVADATRHSTLRSFLVGLAASFLVIPVFVLGIIVLAISIVGIPALLIWVPAFPLAVVLGCLLGYLGVAHAAGEAFAERRFYGGDWFSRANSYYYLLTGLGLMLALFIAGHAVEILGPWLGFIHGILMFLGVVLTWVAATTGFGAVLITRAGAKPVRSARAPGSEKFDAAPAA
jgi:hypothetical protein